MMYRSANASFGREIRRVSRGIRTANNDGTVCFRRKLYNAINHYHRNVHAAAAPVTTAIMSLSVGILFPSSLGAVPRLFGNPLLLRPFCVQSRA
jgi:hypothetical protein